MYNFLSSNNLIKNIGHEIQLIIENYTSKAEDLLAIIDKFL